MKVKLIDGVAGIRMSSFSDEFTDGKHSNIA